MGIDRQFAHQRSPFNVGLGSVAVMMFLLASAFAPALQARPTSAQAGNVLVEAGVSLAPVASGLDRPLWITASPDATNRLFVLEQPGRVMIVADGTLLEQPFLDLRDRVGSEEYEQGLLGLAFHPGYAGNGVFYVYYTDRNGDSVLSRFTVSAADPNRGDPESEAVLLTQDQPFPNHNGGALMFSPDGYLYLGLGDGGSGGDPYGNAQNLGTILGKILRIAVDPTAPPDGELYTIPADNPFVNEPGARPEIWAYGLRNPWRFSFDRETGNLWIADVGQNLWEEVNFQPAESPGGENYGWPVREGTHCYEAETCTMEGLVEPVA
jgi:glucose/arabinose dehydrogenase